MATWTSAFESSPSGEDQGSITALVLRNILTEFKTRLSKEHTFDLRAAPECFHPDGDSSICAENEGTPSTEGIVGAVNNDKTNNKVYRDTGSAMEIAAVLNHNDLATASLAVEDAHSQYIIRDGSSAEVVDNLVIENGFKVTNLDEVAGNYSSSNNFAMPYTLHNGTDASGGAKHVNNSFRDGAGAETTLKYASEAKCKNCSTDVTVLSTTAISSSASTVVTLGSLSFFPRLGSGTTGATAWYLYPVWDAGSLPDDYSAKVTFHNYHGTSKNLEVKVRRFDGGFTAP
jgi:hypothetical protein